MLWKDFMQRPIDSTGQRTKLFKGFPVVMVAWHAA